MARPKSAKMHPLQGLFLVDMQMNKQTNSLKERRTPTQYPGVCLKRALSEGYALGVDLIR